MNIASLFSRRKESPVAGITLGYYGGRPQYHTTNPDAYAKEAYAGNPDVYAAVETLAGAASSIEWYAERRVRGVWTRVDEHPVLDLWNRPNPRLGGTKMVGNLVRWRCIAGEAYLARNEKPQGAPRELYELRPGRMRIIPGSGGDWIGGYEYEVNGRKRRLDPGLVLHLPLFNPLDDFYGLSPLAAAAKLVDQATAAGDYNLGLLQNGGIPPGFLMTDEELGEEEFKRLKKEMQTTWGASNQAGLPQLLEAGMKFQASGRAPSDMQMLEAQRMHALKFAQVIRVPAEFLSGAEEKKYSNYGEALKALYTEGAIPQVKDIRDEVNPWLAPMFGGDVRLVPDFDGIEALTEAEDAKWLRVSNAKHLTINEKRDATGFEPIEGGDVILVAFSDVPLSGALQRGEEPEPEQDEELAATKRKALNLPDEKKAAYWKLVDAKRIRVEGKVEKLVKARMEAETRSIVREINGAATAPATIARMRNAVDDQADSWRELLDDVYMLVGKPFADDTLRELKTSAGPDDRVKAGEDAWVGRVSTYLARVGAAKVQQITSTTKDRLAAELEQGIADGDSIPNLAKRIETLQLEQIIPNRSRTIARTETVAASNAASLAAAESTELPLVKEWIETADERTRDSHIGIEDVALDEAFVLGSGAELEFPGDSSRGADAGDVVNCRCTQAYRVAE